MPVFDPFNEMPEPPSLDGEVRTSPSAGKNSAAEQGLEIPMGWKPTAAEPVPVVRCKATSTTSGERCKRWSIRGTTVCQSHGGRLPNVVEHSQAVVDAARLRIMGMAEDAAEYLEDMIKPGVADQVRLKAIEMVLNRAGIKDAITFEVEVTHNVSLSEDINKRLEIMRQRELAKRKEDEEKEAAELAAQQELEDQGEYLDEDVLDEPEK